MKVKNMTGRTGQAVANQFILETEEAGSALVGIITDYKWDENYKVEYFQSYQTIIAKKVYSGRLDVFLDFNWGFSKTTSKYRNQFLGETKKETQAKIDSGEYVLADLN